MRRTCSLCKQEALFAGRNPVDKLTDSMNMCVKCQKALFELVKDWMN